MIACENSGHNVLDDFAEVSKIVEAGATHKSTRDYELSRYACYLIVQNGDPRKELIALGQTYFAIQTYRQEVADHFNELDEDNRRLVVRGDIKQWNQMLAETAHNAGVITDTSNKEKIDCMVINMYRYLSFEELYQHHSKVSIGYNKDEIANPKEMLMYYSNEMIEQYGVVAIEIKVL